ncbi:MAG: xanthine dehydrogenase family protein subunit M [Pseudomonadota bacterium]
MIPGGFEYHRPDSLAAAVGVLREFGDEARVLAGGHSLIPMMKLRMADVAHLIDVQDIAEMKGICADGDTITIGAMTSQHEVIDSPDIARVVPILHEAALQIADPQVRYCGTIGGNIANGDPGNDMPGVMQCLDATFLLQGPDGAREIAARDFYEAAYTTAREDEEILTAVRLTTHARGYAYEKQKRKIGDYATAAAAVLIEKRDGVVANASVAMTNLSDVPVWSETAGADLVGTDCGSEAVAAAVDAMLGDIDPTDDNRGPVEFKQHVAGVILRRAIARAWSRA